jgi:hypothetical protein
MSRILILSNYIVTEEARSGLVNCSNGCGQSHEFVFKGTKSIDMVCVLNTVTRPHVIWVPRNTVYKIVQEPNVDGSIFHKFVTNHAHSYSSVVGHRGALRNRRDQARFKEEIPHLFPQVMQNGNMIDKTKILSIIASSLDQLPGHRSRNSFVEFVLSSHPELMSHTFGRGRNAISRKEEALDPYMYSLAIENSQIHSYVSEKFIDCILRDTIPIYFGAPNIGEIFPEGSFINLSSLGPEEASGILDRLSREDYLSRLPSLRKAKEDYLSKMKLCCYLTASLESSPVKGRRMLLLVPSFGEVVKKFSNHVPSLVRSILFPAIKRKKNPGPSKE